jgi:hypothetical protein
MKENHIETPAPSRRVRRNLLITATRSLRMERPRLSSSELCGYLWSPSKRDFRHEICGGAGGMSPDSVE